MELLPSLLLFSAGMVLALILSRFFSGKQNETAPLVLLQKTLEKLNRLEERSRNWESFYDFMGRPYLRGGVGETMLEFLLKNWLPESGYKLQYGFKDGTRADAVIKAGPYLVAVDSKFPLESIKGLNSNEKMENETKRQLKKYAASIAAKYIKPGEGTFHFALMYLPSENLFYQAFISDDGSLMDELLKIGIVPVSPSSLFIYLQTIAYGFRGFSFRDGQDKRRALYEQLRNEITLLSKQMGIAETHLKNFNKSWQDIGLKTERLNETVRDDRLL